jgi:hypothetical protein
MPDERGREPRALVILHGKVAPKDVAAFLASLGEREHRLESRGNGRYRISRADADLVYEAEADDRAGAALIIGEEHHVTDELLASLGKDASDTLAAMLRKANTKTPAWGAMDFSWVDDDDPPRAIIGSLDLRRKPALDLLLRMQSPEHAAEVIGEMDGEYFPFPGLVKGEQDGADVRITTTADGKTADKFVKALHEARRRAKRAAAMSQLRWIGNGVEMYEVDHGAPPPSLSAMVEAGQISAWALVSPNAERRELATDDKGVPTEPGDYEYVVLPTGAPGGMVRAYERPELYESKGTIVLFADGSVQWLEKKEFDKKLAATREWLTKQNP